MQKKPNENIRITKNKITKEKRKLNKWTRGKK